MAEGGWIDFGPLAQLDLVLLQQIAPFGSRIVRSAVKQCSHRQGGVVMVIETHHGVSERPARILLRDFGRGKRLCIVP